MYSFFWRLFVTFWLTILMVELFTAWFTVRLSESEIHPILEKRNRQFIGESEQAVAILESQGIAGMRSWLDQADNRRAIDDIFVVDSHRNDVEGKSLPDNIRELLGAGDSARSTRADYFPIQYIRASKAITTELGELLVVSTFKHPHPVSYLLAPHRVAFGIVISGLLCYLLARYFTAPLTMLRRSTQILATGEIDTVTIAHLRHRRDEFGALAVDFENMAGRLNDLLNAKRQLLRDISHELRSPLNRIRVALDLVRTKSRVAGTDEFDRIEREVERLESLISELLMFVRIRSSNVLDTVAAVDLCELLAHIVDDAQYERLQQRSRAEIRLHCLGSVDVKGDARLLHRAIDNIVRNASYYSPANSVIDIRCEQVGTEVRVVVEDSGPGVPSDMLEQIFQPFVRVSAAREADTGGSGIGLAIVQRVIDMHHGTVSAKNRSVGTGLIVTVSLPVSTGEASIQAC